MNADFVIRRAQVYAFLSNAFLYPRENWSKDAPLLAGILADLDFALPGLVIPPMELASLQAAYRHTFGLTSSIRPSTSPGNWH